MLTLGMFLPSQYIEILRNGLQSRTVTTREIPHPELKQERTEGQMETQTDKATRVGKVMALIEISRKEPCHLRSRRLKFVNSEINCVYVFADVINKM